MSFKAFVWAWDQELEQDSHLIVLLALADIANDDGVLFASAAYIGRKCRKNERTVRRALEAMDGKLIQITSRPGLSDIIRLQLPDEHTMRFRDPGGDAGPRGRPRKTQDILENPGHGDQKPRTPASKPPPLVSDEPISNLEDRTGGEIDAGEGDLFGGLPDKKPPRPLKIDVEGAFEEFWRFYPRKVSKGAAYAAFVKALDRIKDPDPVGVLMRGVISLSGECEGKDPQFTPHASTWLNQDGFYDEAGARRPQNVQQPNSASARSSGRVDAFAQAAYELAQERRGRQ